MCLNFKLTSAAGVCHPEAPCPFLIVASFCNDKMCIVVKKFRPQHADGCKGLKQRKQANARALSKMLIEQLGGLAATLTPAKIKAEVVSRVGIKINQSKAKRVRTLCDQALPFQGAKSFTLIADFLNKFKAANAGSHIDIETEEDGATFKRCFLCPGALRDALQFSRPIVTWWSHTCSLHNRWRRSYHPTCSGSCFH